MSYSVGKNNGGSNDAGKTSEVSIVWIVLSKDGLILTGENSQ